MKKLIPVLLMFMPFVAPDANATEWEIESPRWCTLPCGPNVQSVVDSLNYAALTAFCPLGGPPSECVLKKGDKVKITLNKLTGPNGAHCTINEIEVTVNIASVTVTYVDNIPVTAIPTFGTQTWKDICAYPNPNTRRPECGQAE